MSLYYDCKERVFYNITQNKIEVWFMNDWIFKSYWTDQYLLLGEL